MIYIPYFHLAVVVHIALEAKLASYLQLQKPVLPPMTDLVTVEHLVFLLAVMMTALLLLPVTLQASPKQKKYPNL
jgi:hypothetical protein